MESISTDSSNKWQECRNRSEGEKNSVWGNWSFQLTFFSTLTNTLVYEDNWSKGKSKTIFWEP